MIEELIKLKDMNYTKLIIEYSGSGDSGDIDRVYVEDLNENEDEVGNMENINYQAITDYCYYNLLEGIEDWYNDDGGYGRIVIDLDDLSYHIENNIRVYDVESYEHSGEIENKI